MTATDFAALAPWLVLTAGILAVLIVVAVRRDHARAAGVTALSLVLTLATVPLAAGVAPRTVEPLLTVDRYALLVLTLLVLAALGVTAMAYTYFHDRAGQREEFYILMLSATLGAGALAASRHLAMLLLGLELLSVPLFVLAAYRYFQARPLEAGVKYLILAGVATGLLLFGMALLYAQSGELTFAGLARHFREGGPGIDPYAAAGTGLVLAGLAFKLSLVPFHLWTPDVYEGAPAPVSAFLATVSKGAVIALLLRFLLETGVHANDALLLVLTLAGIVSMLAGNLLALLQRNVKRLLAYSSIAHMGYLLVPLAAGGALAVETVGYYLAAYFVMSLGAFGVVAVYSAGDEEERDDLEAYRGLFWRRPWLAGVFTAMLLALAGIPLTAGFVAKFYLFTAGADARLWWLLAALVVGSAIGVFYYLRVVAVMAADAGDAEAPGSGTAMLPGRLTLAVLTVLLVLLGVYPGPLLELLRGTALAMLP